MVPGLLGNSSPAPHQAATGAGVSSQGQGGQGEALLVPGALEPHLSSPSHYAPCPQVRCF